MTLILRHTGCACAYTKHEHACVNLCVHLGDEPWSRSDPPATAGCTTCPSAGCGEPPSNWATAQTVGVSRSTCTPAPNEVLATRRQRSALRSPSTAHRWTRSEEHTSELQSRGHLVCRLLLE